MSDYIIGIDEAKTILDLDADYANSGKLTVLCESSTVFIDTKTGHQWEKDDAIDPLARHACELYMKMQWFAETDYKQDYDYSLGITSILNDLILKAEANKNG